MRTTPLTIVPSQESCWWRCVAYQETTLPDFPFTGPGRTLHTIPLEVEPTFQQIDYDPISPSTTPKAVEGFRKDGHLWRWAKNQAWPDDPMAHLSWLGIEVTMIDGLPTVDQQILGRGTRRGALAIPDMLGWHVLTLLITSAVAQVSLEQCRHMNNDLRDTFAPWQWRHAPTAGISLLFVCEEDRVFLHTRDKSLAVDFIVTRLIDLCEPTSVVGAARWVLQQVAEWVLVEAAPQGIEIHNLELVPRAGAVDVVIGGKWGRSRDVLFDRDQLTQEPFDLTLQFPA